MLRGHYFAQVRRSPASATQEESEETMKKSLGKAWALPGLSCARNSAPEMHRRLS